jgi:hypothetical protein
VELLVTKCISQAIPILHRLRSTNVGDNALGGTQFDARLSIRVNGSLIGFELGFIRRAANTCNDQVEELSLRRITHSVGGIDRSPIEQFSGLEEYVPRTSIAVLYFNTLVH